jgi:hypothetical protein
MATAGREAATMANREAAETRSWPEPIVPIAATALGWVDHPPTKLDVTQIVITLASVGTV